MAVNAKQKLYHDVDSFRERFGIPLLKRWLNTRALCHNHQLADLVCHNFETAGFCGAAYIGVSKDTIVLNSCRSSVEQNFDCGHELIHLTLHRSKNDGMFNCFNNRQDGFLEWQANEGAAQLLVPYQDFIPRFSLLIDQNIHGIQDYLAESYHVSEQVIRFRLDSLAYEIDQYRSGVTIGNIELLSRTQRQKRGIESTCYNAVCDFSFGWCTAVG